VRGGKEQRSMGRQDKEQWKVGAREGWSERGEGEASGSLGASDKERNARERGSEREECLRPETLGFSQDK